MHQALKGRFPGEVPLGLVVRHGGVAAMACEAFGQSRFVPALGRVQGSLELFRIADSRTPAEIADLLRRLGYEPVWKDWEGVLTRAV